MKTSNIILISTAASFTLLLCAGILQNRYAGGEPVEKSDQSNTAQFETIDLPEFDFLVIQNINNVSLSSYSMNQVRIEYKSGENTPQIEHYTRGDTLFIGNKSNSEKISNQLMLFIQKRDLNKIQVINSDVNVVKIPGKNLQMNLDNSQVNVSTSNGGDLVNLKLKGTNQSRFVTMSLRVDTLAVNLDHSNATFLKSVNMLNGSIINNSRLQVKDTQHFDLSRDPSSKLVVME